MRSVTSAAMGHLAALGLMAGVLAPGLALAGSVYLNGVNIDGVTGQKFEKCTVKIDDAGNVFIDAPGYRAQVVQGAPATPPSPVPTPPAATPVTPPPAPHGEAPARITKRYWLVANQNAPGLPEYEIDVYVNAKWLMKLKATSEQDVVDITRFLQPGRNAVLFEAHKLSGDGPRKSYSADHAYSVVVGEGNEGGGNVMIDNALVQYRKTAAEVDSTSKEFTFTTR